MNILFTSLGRRVELVQGFIRSRQQRSRTIRIIGADMADLAPALYFVDKYYIIPAIKDSKFINSLLDICRIEGIKLLIPTIDNELEMLAHNIDRFHEVGTDVLISSPDTIKTTRNKLYTYKLFRKIGIKTPKSYGIGSESINISFPCFIKPISGSSSINAFKVHNERDLEFFKYYIGDYIVQEFIEGEEITIDVMCDFEGNPVFITPRVRLATRSGEVLKAKITYNDKLLAETLLIINELKPKGPITIQAIRNKNGEFYFIEINARFGGGSPLSMMAGADSAGALYDMLEGKSLERNLLAAKSGLIFLRYDQSVVLRQEVDGQYVKV